MKAFKYLKITLLALLLQSHAINVLAGLNIQHWTTAQGSEVYFVENHALPMMDISVNFPAGSAHDSPETSGAAGVTQHLMALVAGGLDEETLTNRFADIGAVLGGNFDADRAGFKLRTLTSEQAVALEAFSFVLHKPDFPEAVLKREQARIVAGLQEAETEPDSIAQKAFMRSLYGTHPYSLDQSGEIDTVQSLTVTHLRQFYETHYTAKSAVISLIGDLTAAQAKQIAERLSAGLPQGPAVAAVPPVPALKTASVKKLPHPALQAHILLGQPGNKRGDADFFPLYVGNYILGGGGFVSRLTEEVREKRGLAYSVYSYFLPMAELGPFQIGLQTKKEQAEEGLQLVKQTVQQFIDKGVTEKELQAAKDNLIGGFPLRIDSNGKILEYLNIIGFYKLPLDYLDSFNDRVAQVTVQQVNDAFKRRLHPENFATVIVGSE
ncbi:MULTISPECIES: pitrilysin family protein [unclassified Methylophilus]|uniref:M16 family metallopeptidase n=1 Tax=unclassified Methylophilus TaxID=2630143 RepID=UPI000700E59D|nr:MULTISPECIES: pitrilysin family protein [unclassified Methylophilus]KQT43751.1 zinc protease [Methylophilus sp. Leaf416]KQT59236.1 zinc protease [Methylophilus sp. Leaf459]